MKLLYKIFLAPILRIILGLLVVPWFCFTLIVMSTSFLLFYVISLMCWIFSGRSLDDIMCWDLSDDLLILGGQWMTCYESLFRKI